jgi:branched-chain amino acid transport system substrate-binding protein
MNKKLLVAIIVTLIVVVAGVGYYYFYRPKVVLLPSGTEIKVGLEFPLTGPSSSGPGLGQDASLAAKLAIDMINERGGVLGKYKVKYWSGDDQGTPAPAASEAERLITENNVQVIIGSWSSGSSMGLTEVCERHGVVAWLPVAWSPLITMRGYNYTFRAGVNAFHAGYAAIDFLYENAEKLGKKPNELKVAIINENSAYGDGVGDAAESKVKAYGMKVVLRQEYPTNTNNPKDLSPIIDKLKDLAPDVLIHAAYPVDAILFSKLAIESEFKVKAYMVFGAAHGAGSVYEALGPTFMEGIPVFDYPNITKDSPYLAELDPDVRDALLGFFTRFEKERGYHPLGPTTNAFGVTWLFLTEVYPAAIQKYRSISPDSLVEVLRELNLPARRVVMGFPIKFYSPGTPEVGQNMYPTLATNHWINGEFTPVSPKKYSLGSLVFPLPEGHPFYPK